MLQIIRTHQVKSTKLNSIKRRNVALMLKSYSMSTYYEMTIRKR